MRYRHGTPQSIRIKCLFNPLTSLHRRGRADRHGGRHRAVVSSAAVIPAVVGMGAGRMVRDRISQQRFRIFVFAFLIVTGVSLIAKAVF